MTLLTANKTPGRTPSCHGNNQGGDQSSNVKVVVRIRPENALEHSSGASRIVVKAMNEHVLVFDPMKEEHHTPGYRKRKNRDLTQRARKDLRFAFDYVFGPHTSNQTVYEHTTKTILEGFLNGYNCSVFAYGATGAGKTHTMLGSENKPGVMYLTMIDLYERIAAIQEEKSCEVAVSYLEVYNEQIRDLLKPQAPLPIREDSCSGVVISGLSLHKPKSADELLKMLQYGNQNRSQHPTDANAESSRSHAVFQVFVKQKDRTANISAEVKVAKMCLVDLAGSERATVTTNRGVRFREGANINKSLLALGNVINALADNKSKGHIPYRDSKLTRILKDSLGGNCRTVMIAAVSPSSMSYDDTYNTLKYADRAKNIRATLKKNILNVDFHVSRYGQIVEDLRKEIIELKSKIALYEEGKITSTKNNLNQEVVRLQDVLHNLFTTRLAVRKEFLDAEAGKRDIAWKIYKKEKVMNRLNILAGEDQVCDNLQKTVTKHKNRLVNLDRHVELASGKYNENCAWLDRVTTEMKLAGGDSKIIPEMLEISLRMHQLEVELSDARHHSKYLKKLIKNQEKNTDASDKLINQLLKLVKKQHYTIKGHNLLTSDLQQEYDHVKEEIDQPEVSWADETVASDTTIDQFKITDIINLPVINMISLKGSTPSRVRNRRRSSNIQKHPDATITKSDVSENKTVGKETIQAQRVPCDNNSQSAARNQETDQTKLTPSRVLINSNVQQMPDRKKDETFTLNKPPSLTSSQTTSCLRRAVLSANMFNQKPVHSEKNKKQPQNTSTTNEITPNVIRSYSARDERPITPKPSYDFTSANVVTSYSARDERPVTPKSSYNLTNSLDGEKSSTTNKIRNTNIERDEELSSSENSTPNYCSPDLVKSSYKARDQRPITPKLSYDFSSAKDTNNVSAYAAREARPITPKASYDFMSAKDTNNVSAYAAREERPITPKASYDFMSAKDICDNPSSNLNSTYVKPGENHTDPSLEQTYVKSGSSSVQDETVILSSPRVLKENNINSTTVNKTTSINNATVTKAAPTTQQTSDQPIRKPVARSIKFESTPPSGTGMSYADVVKSPSPVRTPLLQINNNTKQTNRLNITPQQQYKINLDTCTPNYKLSNTCKENLHKLRQNMEKSRSNTKGSSTRTRPNYMSMTKSIRNRLQFKDDDPMTARRVPVTSKYSLNRGMSKSKSTSHLSRNGWQF
ncbi:kinesin-like protein KIF18A [Patella vulgata]|uniref:kinesin-like protein KIF18A n=1 Tax=Patella vulgata TaxID=6465 RepID=UPI0024A896DF|nr:kinesin-like protein KIF18A [Patella vulgata]